MYDYQDLAERPGRNDRSRTRTIAWISGGGSAGLIGQVGDLEGMKRMKEISDQIVSRIRQDFPALSRRWEGRELSYFDGPGGSQVPWAVIDAVSAYYRSCNSNTHGMFVTSRETDLILEEARLAMADFLGAAGPETVSFGANMTTLNYSLSHALARKFKPGDEILITALDHEANRGPWLGLREQGLVIRELPVTEWGTLDYSRLEELVTPRTRLVAAGWASNALGTVNDIMAIREKARAAGALFLVDAVHYAPHFPIDAGQADPDFLLCSAYKFYGPHVGILYSRPGLLEDLEPDRLSTQDQKAPFRIETGTLNHAAVAGVKAAVDYLSGFGSGESRRARLVEGMSLISRHEHGLARVLYQGLEAIPGTRLYGPPIAEEPGGRTPTVSFRVAGVDPAEACRRLGEQGFLLWDGDFYAARVIEALGLAEKGGVIRAGISLYTRREDVEALLDAVRALA